MGGDNQNGPNGSGSLSLEIYKPSYFFEERPIIEATPQEIMNYGVQYTFNMDSDASRIIEVAIIRPGSVTHGFNVDQRYIELKIISIIGNTITVQPPFREAVAVPGYYMLVALSAPGCLSGQDACGESNEGPHCGKVPSIARWVRLIH